MKNIKLLQICCVFSLGVTVGQATESTGLGDAQTQLKQGEAYLQGAGVEANLEKAFQCLEAAAKSGDAWSQVFLAYAYHESAPDKVGEAIKLATKYHNDYYLADWILANCYTNGRGTKQDVKLGMQMHEKLDKENYEGVWCFSRAFGYLLREGVGDMYDNTRAMSVLEQSAKKGDLYAQKSMAMYYAYGTDTIPPNKQKAYKWYKLAAEQGDSGSQLMLYSCCLYGIGTKQSNEQALYWLERSANANNAEAQCRLGEYYLSGELGLTPDSQKAVVWATKSANQGMAEAQNVLAYCYHFGVGVPKDAKLREYWLMKAAEKNYDPSFLCLYSLERGRGNMEKSIYWLERSAANDNIESLIAVGEYYYTHEPSNTTDKEKGKQMLLRAVDLGSQLAVKKCQKLFLSIPNK